MQVASDNGLGPVTGPTENSAGDVGGLIAAVESKMSELMAWHAQQVKQLETDKTVLKAQNEQERELIGQQQAELATQREQLASERGELDGRCEELEKEKRLLAERTEQVDQQRVKLVELTSKLRAEESAMSREWAEVQRGRESLQQQADALSAQRVRIDERAKQWLDTTASELSQPLKLAESTTGEEQDAQDEHDRDAA